MYTIHLKKHTSRLKISACRCGDGIECLFGKHETLPKGSYGSKICEMDISTACVLLPGLSLARSLAANAQARRKGDIKKEGSPGWGAFLIVISF